MQTPEFLRTINSLSAILYGSLFSKDVQYFEYSRSFDMELNEGEVEADIQIIKNDYLNQVSELHKVYTQTNNEQLNLFINSLKKLYSNLLDYETAQRDHIRQNNEEDSDLRDVRSGYAMKVMENTTGLLKDLRKNNFDFSSGQNAINNYINKCNVKANDSRLVNCLKAILVVALSAAYLLIGIAAGALITAGSIIGAPVLGAVCFNNSIQERTFGAIGATILGPPLAVAYGLYTVDRVCQLGFRSAKEWLGIPKHESITHHGFFKPSPIINDIKEVKKQGERILQNKY